MILIVVGGYTGLLWLLVKIGVLKKWYGWMKVSPIVVGLVVFLAIFFPLNWNAPMGGTTVTMGSVGIKTPVAGRVTDVVAQSWVPIKEGDILFEIDKTAPQAALKKAKAQLLLAKDQLKRKQGLLTRDVVSESEVEILQANVEVAEAAVTAAEVELSYTTIRAPFDGMIPAMTLLPGSWANANTDLMAYLDVHNPFVVLVLNQNQIRNVKPGQTAEAVFRTFPGRTFTGTVKGLFLSSRDAEYVLDGATPNVPQILDTDYVVELELDMQGLVLPPGSSGQGTVLTDKGTKFQFINQLTLRMTSWMNYL
ncbi:MAG: HlyD family secretion protein [Rhizobiaceae bacterium]